ncbi:hypothetical protein ACFYUY_12055 [Kitasatospora sp. NPDC004745]|uniref:hypothetical protein n=1 Tax=Kitasatospora sp. NPDC004745 TaxID=3364019 RepID=UPI00369DC9A2
MSDEQQDRGTDESAGRSLPGVEGRPRAPQAGPPERRRRRRIVFTSELSDDLAPAVRELAVALRLLAGQLETSMTAYAASLNRSTSTLSRYFSGIELPGADFVERLMDDAERQSGTPMARGGREAVRASHRAAQRHLAPRTAELQGLRDEVTTAHQRAEAAARTVRMLEAALEEAHEQARRWSLETRRAIADLNARTAGHSVELDLARKDNEHLRAEHDRLRGYVDQLEHALAAARTRAAEAEHRQTDAERRLDEAEAGADARRQEDARRQAEADELRRALDRARQDRTAAEQRARRSAAELARIRAQGGGGAEASPPRGAGQDPEPAAASGAASGAVGTGGPGTADGTSEGRNAAGGSGAFRGWLDRVLVGDKARTPATPRPQQGQPGPSEQAGPAARRSRRKERQEAERAAAVRQTAARLALHQGYRTAEPVGRAGGLGGSADQASDRQRRIGDWQGSTMVFADSVEEAVTRRQAAGDWAGGAVVFAELGRGLAAEGRWEEAAEAVDRAVALHEGAGAAAAAADLLTAFAQDLAAAGLRQHAEVVAARSAVHQRAGSRTAGDPPDDEPPYRPYMGP